MKHHIAIMPEQYSVTGIEQDFYWDGDTKEILQDKKVIGHANDKTEAEIILEEMYETVVLD